MEQPRDHPIGGMIGSYRVGTRDTERRWWRSTSLHREMAWVGGTLYLSGGVLVLLVLLLPSWELYAPHWVAGAAGVAIAVGAFFLWAAEHRRMPLWQYAIATSIGAVLVTIAAAGGGADTTAVFGVLYVFVAAYGFYYYPWPVAVWLVALSGVGFAGVLQWHDAPAAVVQWLLIMGAAVIAGGLIGSLGRRVRRLLAVEQATVADLNELDRWRTTFLRAVAHDLRSPLTVMLGLLMTIGDYGDHLPAARRDELLGRSISAGRRLEQLIGDLLDLQRIEAGQLTPRLEPTALHELVGDSLAALDLGPRPVDVDLRRVTAQVEPAKVERILVNLVTNALHHTPDDAHVWVRVHSEDDVAVLTVEDSGPGLPDSVRAELYEAFTTAADSSHTAHPSVGLGLHLAQQFTAFHGGTVSASDRPGGGSRFEVRLPLDPTRAAAEPRTRG